MGGTIESFQDAEEQANEATTQEAARKAGQADEEAEEAGIEESRHGSP
jgi:hypothetical protein